MIFRFKPQIRAGKNRLGFAFSMFTEKELKIVAKALDPVVPESEWNNAANLFFKLLRNRSATSEEFQNNHSEMVVIPPTQPDFGLTFMPWGKYKDQMFRDIPLGWLMAKRDWIRSAPDILAKWGNIAEAIDRFLGQ